MQGYFKPRHPEKYEGNVKNIIYRSSWEFNYMMKLDSDPAVVAWVSEGIRIPYYSPKDRRIHGYYPDFIICKRFPSGRDETFMIEIKPMNQCVVPKNKPGKSRRRLINETFRYAVNQAKWQAASKYCSNRGWVFKVLTERELKVW